MNCPATELDSAGRPVNLAEAYVYFSMAALPSGGERDLAVSYKQAIETALSPAGLTEAKKRFYELTNDKG